MSQNEASHRYLTGVLRNGRSAIDIGTDYHRLIEMLYGSSVTARPWAFAFNPEPVRYMYADCDILRREAAPETALERITPHIGPVMHDAWLGPFSSFTSYFRYRSVEREFEAHEIERALHAYRTSTEYTAPVVSSRGLLWPFATLTS
jgi:hypothetical protein